MGNYTSFFEEKAINIFAEEDYIEELKKNNWEVSYIW